MPPGLRYGCIGCGRSCTDFDEVEIDPAEAERIRRLPLFAPRLATVDAGASRLPYHEPPTGPGRIVLERVATGGADGGARCVFLDDDRRCALHGAHGPEVKPRTCRVFPFHFVDTPTGIFAGLSFACTAVLLDRGPLVSTQPAEVRAALALARPARAGHGDVWLVPGTRIGWGEYRDIERALGEVRDPGGTASVLDAQAAWLRRHARLRGAHPRPTSLPAVSGDDIGALAGRARRGGAGVDDEGIDREELVARYFAHRLFRKDLLRAPDLLAGVERMRVDLIVIRSLPHDIGAIEAVRVVEQHRVLHAGAAPDPSPGNRA